MISRKIALIAIAGVVLGACTPSAAVRAARQGDRQALERAITSDRAAGRLDKSAIEDLASEVLSREVLASSPRDAITRIGEASACARQVKSALQTRAKRHDDAAPVATMALLEADLASTGDFEARVKDGNPAWRAVGARSCVSRTCGPIRRALIVDPDERVRLGALRAAVVAAERQDAPSVMDAARLDPNGLARVTAVRAAGVIGGSSLVLGLADRFPTGDEPLRVAIVGAWGTPKMLADGGERELALVAERDTGMAGVAAATTLAAQKAGHARGAALAALARLSQHGTTAVRLSAISALPSDNEQAALFVELADDRDGMVRAAALAKLATIAARHDDALARLHDLARAGNVHAEALLANEGDPDALRALAALARTPEVETRRRVGRDLIAARDLVDAADLLADKDASTRTEMACGILVATESTAPLTGPATTNSAHP